MSKNFIYVNAGCTRLKSLSKCICLVVVFVLSGFFMARANSRPAKRADIHVQGVVTAADGETLPGVSVKIKGTTRGTLTDLDGKFNISVPDNATLEFVYVGYITQSVAVNGQTRINVKLKTSVSDLNEVVVLGYGSVKKSDVTGSISTLKLEDVNESRNISVPEAMQGKLAGVQITSNTGEPGSGMSFKIRGSTSVTGSSQPLIVIDGQPIESGFDAASAGMKLNPLTGASSLDPLASINPADIASIEVLKDASSTAIYGSRGANGVVLITTKSGSKNGPDKVSYTFRTDASAMPKLIPVLNTTDYLAFVNEANVNDGKAAVYTQAQIDSTAAVTNSNFQDLIYRTAISQDHQLSLSGGEAKNNYLISGNYTDQNSMIINAGLTRAGLRANYDRQVTDKLKISMRSYVSLTTRNYAQQSNGAQVLSATAVAGALAFRPDKSPYDASGELDEDFANNPLLVTTLAKDRTNIRTGIFNLSGVYNITKHLTYTVRGALNDITSLREQYWPHGTFLGNSQNGSATRADNANTNYLVDNLLSYDKAGKKSTVNAVVGYSYQQWVNKGSSLTSTDFPSDDLTYNNFASAGAPGQTTTINQQRALSSFLGRVNYAYMSKYLLTLTGRFDGATRLAEGHKWNFFPSVGLGWNVNNESFFKNNIKGVSVFKLRASYGVAGNDAVPIGATQPKYVINYGTEGPSILPGFEINNFSNSVLTWEDTKQLNIGTDITFLNDRATLSFDYYRKTTTNLLINLSLSPSSTYDNYYTNLGKMANNGFDVEGTYDVLRSSKLRWTLGANFSKYDNKVVDLGLSNIIYGPTYINNGNTGFGQPVSVAKTGEPLSSFWGYKTNGIYQNAAQVAAGPEAATAKPGDVRFVDLNGDGQINSDDKTIIGNPNASYTYGLNSDLSYKNFSFSFNMMGSQGNDVLNLNNWLVGANDAVGNLNATQRIYDGRWTGEGTSNLYPRANIASARFNSRLPDWMVEDGSYVRLQNVTIGYNFKLPGALSRSMLKVFISGSNLITITKYTGYDPNVNGFGQNPISAGVDYGVLPVPRTFSAGLTLTL